MRLHLDQQLVYICMKCICAAARNAGLPSAACKPELGKAPGCSRDAVVLKDGGRNVPARACGSHESENAETRNAQELGERDEIQGLCSLEQRQPCMKPHSCLCDMVRVIRCPTVPACCHMQECCFCKSYAEEILLWAKTVASVVTFCLKGQNDCTSRVPKSPCTLP